jgi:hypothetical protein
MFYNWRARYRLLGATFAFWQVFLQGLVWLGGGVAGYSANYSSTQQMIHFSLNVQITERLILESLSDPNPVSFHALKAPMIAKLSCPLRLRTLQRLRFHTRSFFTESGSEAVVSSRGAIPL